MANDINRVTLVGRFTRDPEFKSINGTSLVNFSLANGRTYVSNGEKEKSPTFSIVKSGENRLILFNNTAKRKADCY